VILEVTDVYVTWVDHLGRNQVRGPFHIVGGDWQGLPVGSANLNPYEMADDDRDDPEILPPGDNFKAVYTITARVNVDLWTDQDLRMRTQMTYGSVTGDYVAYWESTQNSP
jgi:hypothetical protein